MGGERSREDRANALEPVVHTSDAPDVSRRRLLKSSAIVGASATTPNSLTPVRSRSTTVSAAVETPTVFVFNTGNKTVSLVDAETAELLRTVYLGATSSFPSNQYTPSLVDTPRRTLWLNVDNGVLGLDPRSLNDVARVQTGAEANYVNLSPDGQHVVVSAREPTHKQFRIDADPDSDEFGTVTATIDRTEGYDGPRKGPGPCDVTFGPEGTYAYVPDVFGDTITVIRVPEFEVVTQVHVEPVAETAAAARPYMGTVSWDGRYWMVENNEGDWGTVSIWDVSEPAQPVELVRLTKDDDLGKAPLTDEIGPDNGIAYVFTPGTKDVTVVDLEGRSVVKRIPLGGKAYAGTWGPDKDKLFVPIQTTDQVAVIEHEKQAVTETIPVGPKPYGATAARVRPAKQPTNGVRGALAAVGIDGPDEDATYCIGDCHCGPHNE